MSAIFATAITLLLLVILVIIFILSIMSAYRIQNKSGFSTPHKYLTASAVILGLAFATLILMAILVVIGAALTEGIEIEGLAYIYLKYGSAIYIFAFIFGVMLLLCGILCAIAAYDIGSSPDYSNTSDDIRNAYHYAVYAAVISFISVFIVVLGIYFFHFHGKQSLSLLKNSKSAKVSKTSISTNPFDDDTIAVNASNTTGSQFSSGPSTGVNMGTSKSSIISSGIQYASDNPDVVRSLLSAAGY